MAIPGALPWVITGVLGAVLVVGLSLLRVGPRWSPTASSVPPGPTSRWRTSGRPRPSTPKRPALAMGPDADARAFLVIRPYLTRAVRVPVTDPADPTPYWLVGSRHPDALAAALNARPDPPGEAGPRRPH